jgi:hypothetical protein
MDFQKLQTRQIIRLQKLWSITRRQALVQARTLLQTGLEYVDVLESKFMKKTAPSRKNPAKLTAKKPLKAYVEKLNKSAHANSQSEAIRNHKQTMRHH